MEDTSSQVTYPTDLSDAQWKLIEGLIPAQSPVGVDRTTDMRATLNAIFYLLRTGCAWRMLPTDYPPWQTVYEYFSRWRNDGVVQRRRPGGGQRRQPAKPLLQR